MRLVGDNNKRFLSYIKMDVLKLVAYHSPCMNHESGLSTRQPKPETGKDKGNKTSEVSVVELAPKALVTSSSKSTEQQLEHELKIQRLKEMAKTNYEKNCAPLLAKGQIHLNTLRERYGSDQLAHA